MTTEGNPNLSGAAGQPAGSPNPAAQPAQQPSPQSGASGTFDAAVRQETQQHAARAESMSAAEIHAEADRLLKDSKSAYWQDGLEHDHAVATVFRSRELKAAAEGDAPEEMSTSTRLANRAMSLGDLPIPQAAMNPKVVEADADLANALRFFDRENISTPTLKRALSSYANMLAATGGRITDEGLAMLEREVGHEFHPQQKALLIRWLKEEVEPSLAKLRARRGR